jgi:integrase
MRKHHPKNERIKREYRFWLQDARQKTSHSVDQIGAAIALFEESTGYKDFAVFHIEQARKFKSNQLECINPETGKPLAKATVKHRLDSLKAFFKWLADQPKYRARIKHADCEYFNLSANDARIATAKRERPAPDLEQVHYTLSLMKAETAIEKRDRAILAFALLTGARDDAIASFRLKHVDVIARKVFQDARDVRTKNRKTFETWFFPVGGEAATIVTEWIAYLKAEHKFGPDDPLFPQSMMTLDVNNHFQATGLKRECWKNADAIRRVFRAAFANAGLPYFHPHSLRTTLARLGEKICNSPEEFKAWSQNMGHNQVMTTFTNYGKVMPDRQAQIIQNLGKEKDQPEISFNDRIANLEAIVLAQNTTNKGDDRTKGLLSKQAMLQTEIL